MSLLFVDHTFWVEAYRNETLTFIFQGFPYLASTPFYIGIITWIYWRAPTLPLGKMLGFLVSGGTLLSSILKNVVQHPRPPNIFHLVQVPDPFGFPSGDVLVATVFWITLTLSFRQHKSLPYISSFLIISILLSRVYLGVHCPWDVAGGLLIGLLMVLVWHTPTVQQAIRRWFNGKQQGIYWIFVAMIALIYCLTAHDLRTSVRGDAASFGALIGIGLSLSSKNSFQPLPFLSILVGFLCVAGWAFFFPIIKTSSLLYFITNIVKYAGLIWIIYSGLPAYFSKKHLTF